MRVLRRIIGGIIIFPLITLMLLPDFLESVANIGLRNTLILYAMVAAFFAILAFGCWLLFGD